MSLFSMLFQEQDKGVAGQERAGLPHPMTGILPLGRCGQCTAIARQGSRASGWRPGCWAVKKWLSGCNRPETSLCCATAEGLQWNLATPFTGTASDLAAGMVPAASQGYRGVNIEPIAARRPHFYLLAVLRCFGCGRVMDRCPSNNLLPYLTLRPPDGLFYNGSVSRWALHSVAAQALEASPGFMLFWLFRLKI